MSVDKLSDRVLFVSDNKRKMEDSAQAEVSKTKRPTPQSSDLVVLNLPYHYSKENLIDYFSKHGDIAFAQVRTASHFYDTSACLL